ncbi:21 kDa protein-like [Phalaenopsis equestris]|uniref:21 kDa protein-like n=1 Tax=Phalaenopsis equestris TaxID=78828 RepID=UPI0009E44909|nr:21 kDa protein-like [Phalaenopsis equestris]
MATLSRRLLLLLLLLTTISPAVFAILANSTDFIRRSCAVTLYPQLCYISLKPYAKNMKESPLALAIIATEVSLANIKKSALQAEALRHHRTGSAGAALHDCLDLLRTAEDLTKQSVAEIQKLWRAVKLGGSSFFWDVSNAQTWMSAALTDEDTCVDGFEDVGGAAAVKGFIRNVRRVKKYSSNALALLNALVEG